MIGWVGYNLPKPHFLGIVESIAQADLNFSDTVKCSIVTTCIDSKWIDIQQMYLPCRKNLRGVDTDKAVSTTKVQNLVVGFKAKAAKA
jgi:hypothetical protein